LSDGVDVNGAESLVHTLLNSGVDTCFANPGTSEMHFVSALDRIPGMHCVLALAETVATGAADGYARIAERPAVTLLHCGPGLANGLANLHNARRANSPIVNIVGDQATHHRPFDAPLTADTEGMARAVSAWTRTATSATHLGRDAATAIQAARTSPGQIATLIVPSDTCWNSGGVVAEPLEVPATPQIDEGVLAPIARALLSGERTVLFLGNDALREQTLSIAGRIAQKTGAMLMAPTSNRRIERGAGRVPIKRLAYPVDTALAELRDVKHMILVGTKAPVAFFAYPDKPSLLYPESCQVHVLSRPEQDQLDALARLADRLGAIAPCATSPLATIDPAQGQPTPDGAAQTVAALLPEDAIVVEEGLTFGRSFYPMMANAPRHDWLHLTGGAIGSGLPLATGAAVAGKGRRVVSLQADGSGMYSLQALWTQANEQLDVTTIIFANRKYAVLLGELAQVGADAGKTALNMLDLSRPPLDWVHLANGMGVEAAKATTLEELADLLIAANSRKGPFLIELVI